ncbi:MAG TPA: substrate-binding domain-containing protein [Planctomycetaceae bacterium]
MRRRFWSTLTFCCLATVFLIGCGGDSPSGGAGAGGKSDGGTGKASEGSGAAGDFKIVILTNGSSPFWDACHVGLKDAGKELGIRVELVRNDATEGGQIRRLEQLATQSDVKGVAISVLESQAAGVAGRMKALRDKGVKVITIDSDGPRDAREAFVGTNNLEGGRELGKLAAQLRPTGGKAVAFVGFLGAQNAKERIQGFKEGMGDKFELVDSMEDGVDNTKAQNNVTASIQNHPDVNILAGIWSYNAPAIAKVISANGRRQDFTIVTFDCEPGAIVAMEKGLIDAMVVQDPYNMGYTGANLLHHLITGDQAGVDEYLKGGDNVDTGLKVIVPTEDSPLQSRFRTTLFDFKSWLKEKGLKGS